MWGAPKLRREDDSKNVEHGADNYPDTGVTGQPRTMGYRQTMFTLSELFEAPPVGPYPTWEDEIQAVAQGLKGICWHGSTKEEIENPTEEEERIYDLAYSLGLTVIVRLAEPELQTPSGDWFDIFFLKMREVWRVEALIATKKAQWGYGTSDAIMYLRCKILGYGTERSQAWLAWQQKSRLGWIGQTVYLILTKRETASLNSTGNRCFPQALVDRPVELFHAPSGYAPRENIHEVLPGDMELYRFALENEFFIELFRNAKEAGPVVIVLLGANINELNRAIVSNIEIIS